MANAKELMAWFLKNAHPLQAKVEKLNWIQEFSPDLTDVAVEIVINDIKWTGWGIGQTQELACVKALAEALERAMMQENKIENSNGMAAHLSYELAQKNAIQELIERDLFLCHFYTHSPLNRAPDNLVTKVGLSSYREWLNAHQIDLSLYWLTDSGVVCCVDGRRAHSPFGYIIGAALKDDLYTSVKSAIFETARASFNFIKNKKMTSSLTIEEFAKLPSKNFADHGRLALDISYANTISWLFDSNTKILNNRKLLKIRTETLLSSNPILRSCPLHFVRASSIEMQSLFIGEPKEEKMNFQALRQFTNLDLTWNSLVKLAHPFA